MGMVMLEVEVLMIVLLVLNLAFFLFQGLISISWMMLDKPS